MNRGGRWRLTRPLGILAASFVLASETQQLTSLVERFKIDDGEAVERKQARKAAVGPAPERKATAARKPVGARGPISGAATARKIEPRPRIKKYLGALATGSRRREQENAVHYCFLDSMTQTGDFVGIIRAS